EEEERQRPCLGSRIDEALPRADENDQSGDAGDEKRRVRPDIQRAVAGELDVVRIVGVRQTHAGEKRDAECSEESEFGVRCVSTALKAALTRRTPSHYTVTASRAPTPVAARSASALSVASQV